MTAEEIRNFCARDWHAIERLKSDFWKEQNLAPDERFAIAAGLYEYASALYPDWPNEAEREEDLRPHIRVSRMLHRAGTG